MRAANPLLTPSLAFVCGSIIISSMVTQPIDIAKVYALTSAGACSVTLTQGNHSITWTPLTDAGQTSIIVPAGATLSIPDTGAVLSPLPATFKAALGAGTASTEGEMMIQADGDDLTPVVHIQHAVWCTLPTATAGCTICPHESPTRVYSMQLLLTPAADLPTGWLSTTDEAYPVYWPFGEPLLVAGYRYCITLVQLSDMIIANMTPLGTV